MELKLCLSIKEINQKNLIKQSLSMNNIITELSRPVRRRLKRVVQFNKDGNYRRRAKAILLLNEGYSRKQVSQLLSASRTSIRKWVQRFEQFGESALVPENRGRTPYSINEALSLIKVSSSIRPQQTAFYFGKCIKRYHFHFCIQQPTPKHY